MKLPILPINKKRKKKIYSPYPNNWRNLSNSVKNRDEYTCYECGRHKNELSKGEYLEVHHIFSVKTGNNRNTNLKTLCSKCHNKKHQRRK